MPFLKCSLHFFEGGLHRANVQQIIRVQVEQRESQPTTDFPFCGLYLACAVLSANELSEGNVCFTPFLHCLNQFFKWASVIFYKRRKQKVCESLLQLLHCFRLPFRTMQ